ncbi:hypothetical protein GOZ84_18135 [Agrobacterium vitis]|nr:hypothetical protein [Agrobacterium vitis]MVA64083.1 hypothetical protein [Agrobacterium vitis]
MEIHLTKRPELFRQTEPPLSNYSNPLDLLADPDEPRDLFGMLLRRKALLAAS